MNQFKRLYNFYFRVSAIIFGKQSILSLFISDVFGESPTTNEPIFLSDIEASRPISDAFTKILSYNGLGEGQEQKVILNFLGEKNSDTISGADAKFIITRSPDLPSWILGEAPKQMPVSENAFKIYYMKAWRESFLKKEESAITHCLVYVAARYFSLYQDSFKDKIFKRLFFEDLRLYKQKFPDAHVWIPEIVNKEINIRRITQFL